MRSSIVVYGLASCVKRHVTANSFWKNTNKLKRFSVVSCYRQACVLKVFVLGPTLAQACATRIVHLYSDQGGYWAQKFKLQSHYLGVSKKKKKRECSLLSNVTHRHTLSPVKPLEPVSQAAAILHFLFDWQSRGHHLRELNSFNLGRLSSGCLHKVWV